jgi:hypothetical protein
MVTEMVSRARANGAECRENSLFHAGAVISGRRGLSGYCREFKSNLQVPMMKRLCISTLMVFACLSPALALAASGSLNGSYELGGKTLIDPPDGEPQDTHLRLFLEGGAARDLFAALDVKAVEDECLADGSMTKSLGGIACTMHADGHTYECSFAVNIKSRTVEGASAC